MTLPLQAAAHAWFTRTGVPLAAIHAEGVALFAGAPDPDAAEPAHGPSEPLSPSDLTALRTQFAEPRRMAAGVEPWLVARLLASVAAVEAECVDLILYRDRVLPVAVRQMRERCAAAVEGVFLHPFMDRAEVREATAEAVRAIPVNGGGEAIANDLRERTALQAESDRLAAAVIEAETREAEARNALADLRALLTPHVLPTRDGGSPVRAFERILADWDRLRAADSRRVTAAAAKIREQWDELGDLAEQVAAARAERDQARATASRLNRRCQRADGIIQRSGIIEGREQGGKGRSLGRALANYAAAGASRELEAARPILDAARAYAEAQRQWAAGAEPEASRRVEEASAGLCRLFYPAST